MAQRSDLASLLSLLDDEDETVAVNAMAELLNREAELGDALAVLQESDHPLVRRRSHQLQAAITLRRRRREFAYPEGEPERRGQFPVQLGGGHFAAAEEFECSVPDG